jgi:hypothetical protein
MTMFQRAQVDGKGAENVTLQALIYKILGDSDTL